MHRTAKNHARLLAAAAGISLCFSVGGQAYADVADLSESSSTDQSTTEMPAQSPPSSDITVTPSSEPGTVTETVAPPIDPTTSDPGETHLDDSTPSLSTAEPSNSTDSTSGGDDATNSELVTEPTQPVPHQPDTQTVSGEESGVSARTGTLDKAGSPPPIAVPFARSTSAFDTALPALLATPSSQTTGTPLATQTSPQALMAPIPVVPVQRTTLGLLALFGAPLLSTGTPTTTVGPGPWLLLWFARRHQAHWHNQAPTGTPTTPTLNADGTYSGAVIGQDREGDPITYRLVSEPDAGTLELNADGTYTYTPTAALAQSGGAQSFTVELSDATGRHHHHFAIPFWHGKSSHSTTTTVTINVDGTPVETNHPPNVEVTDPVRLPVAAPDDDLAQYQGTVKFTDPENDALTVLLTGVIPLLDGDNTPVPGTFVTTSGGIVVYDPATGSYLYTPAPDARHAAAAVGANPTGDEFGFVASDGLHTVAHQVIVPIEPKNSAPELQIVNQSSPDPQTGVVTGSFTVTDADGDPIQISFGGQQTSAGVYVFDDGVLEVLESQGVPGTYSYVFTPSTNYRLAASHGTGTSPSARIDVALLDGYGDPALSELQFAGAPITGQGSPYGGTVQYNGGVYYMTGYPPTGGNTTISIVDPGSDVISAVVLPGSAAEIRFAPNGDAYVWTSHNSGYHLHVIDAETHELVTSVPITGNIANTNDTIQFAEDGTAFVLSSENDKFHITTIPTDVTPTISPVTHTIEGQRRATNLTVSGNRAYIPYLSEGTHKVLIITTAGAPSSINAPGTVMQDGIRADDDGTVYLITSGQGQVRLHELDNNAWVLVKSFNGSVPSELVIRDGSAYVTYRTTSMATPTNHRVDVISLDDGSTRTIEVDGFPSGGVLFIDDRPYLLTRSQSASAGTTKFMFLDQDSPTVIVLPGAPITQVSGTPHNPPIQRFGDDFYVTTTSVDSGVVTIYVTRISTPETPVSTIFDSGTLYRYTIANNGRLYLVTSKSTLNQSSVWEVDPATNEYRLLTTLDGRYFGRGLQFNDDGTAFLSIEPTPGSSRLVLLDLAELSANLAP